MLFMLLHKLVRYNTALGSNARKVHQWASTRIYAVVPGLDSVKHGTLLSMSLRSVLGVSPNQKQSLPRCAYSTVAGSAGGPQQKKLFLYSKEGCHLCDGLKEKIQALLDRAQFMPSPLSDISFEVRDITTEPAWWEAYSLTIPVLTVADSDGSKEVKVPRPSPRISTDRLGQHLEKALESREQET